MQGFFIVIGILLGLSSMVKSEMGFYRDIDKLIEKKMEAVMKKYDRKIALLEDKIHNQENKIQILEEKCSGQVLVEEKEKEDEESTHLYAASNRSTVTSAQKNPELKRPTILSVQKRVVPGMSLYTDFLVNKFILRTRNAKSLFFISKILCRRFSAWYEIYM